ncbi:MAG TPA: SAM-dependent methyltransferase [Sphingomicrobium sp.]|nr:SAM-dependent methyltransferase [Sphingomicrobium sp.]
MTPLERALRDRIRAEGPITVEAYMEACNSYYYGTRDPLGVGGDFTTAPEVSQMFGEMVGAALADCWRRAGSPAGAIYTELGPGRGTLASDALRVLRPAGFRGDVHFVETSPVLRGAQALTVPDAQSHDIIEDLPQAPLLLVANEFLDALPVRQSVDGVERRVVLAANGLAFDRDGEIMETSPTRERVTREFARRLVEDGGVALIFDYGQERSGPGETLQAVRAHRFAPVLESPGEHDLTAHVDFEAVASAAKAAGAVTSGIVSQGEWLKRVGIEARAQALVRSNPDSACEIDSALHRLTEPEEMGTLFKVMAIRSPVWPLPAGLE